MRTLGIVEVETSNIHHTVTRRVTVQEDPIYGVDLPTLGALAEAVREAIVTGSTVTIRPVYDRSTDRSR